MNLGKVLRCGQAFRWKKVDSTWSCSLANRVVLLKQDESHIHYTALWPVGMSPKLDDTEDFLKDYLQLKVPLGELYTLWKLKDPHFAKVDFDTFAGIRMLRQDPWETLISFICSTNNNVKRISKMCDSLCRQYGEYLLSHDGLEYYTFPSCHKLNHLSTETVLRELGFGYRAKYIHRTAQIICEDETYNLGNLYKLREEPDYRKVADFLINFQGVGPKVADCVMLMSLDKESVVPVDTHVFNIVRRDYKRFTGAKTISRDVYCGIQDFFTELWGDYAGWAHSVLFARDLADLNNGVNVEKLEKKIKMEERLNGIEIESSIQKDQETIKEEETIQEENTIKEEEIIYSVTGRPKRSVTIRRESKRVKVIG